MAPHPLSRTALGVTASLAVPLPATGCSSTDTDTQSPSERAPSTSAASPSPSRPSSSSANYEDGTYTARGVYGGAPSYITVSLTVADNTITDATVEPMPENNDTSRGYQERFAAALPDEVIGRTLDDADVDVLAGASGCADGFNDALAKIR